MRNTHKIPGESLSSPGILAGEQLNLVCISGMMLEEKDGTEVPWQKERDAMSKKIAQFLPAVFALIALVMLLGIAAERDAPAETEPPATTAPAVQTAEETGADQPGETLPTDAKPRVEAALGRHSLDETATASCIRDDALHADSDTTGAGKAACAYALADLCDEQRMNPIAAFWMLTRESLFAYERGEEEALGVPAFALPIQSRKQYPYTTEGTRELLTDILNLSADVGEGMEMEDRVLGLNDEVDSFQVFYDKDDRCYYAYFILYGERSAHFLCFYIRGSELIDDFEFQLLNLRYAEGDGSDLEQIDRLGDCQAATIMAAAEQLLTGTSRADEGSIPLGYTCDGSQVSIERFAVTGDGETGTLTNYDLHIKG